VRIISGIAKARALVTPDAQNTKVRPTSDRAREALFSSLESEFSGLAGLSFLDLYGGTGAVAAEALSRGASLVVTVEEDREIIEIARQNLALVQNLIDASGGSARSEAVCSSVESFLAIGKREFDIIFMDPPYSFTNDQITKTLKALIVGGMVRGRTLILVERDSKSQPFSWPDGLAALKERRYGHARIFYGEKSQDKL
jgi:16S rRNA (guanine966-N2)-methyltransferase